MSTRIFSNSACGNARPDARRGSAHSVELERARAGAGGRSSDNKADFLPPTLHLEQYAKTSKKLFTPRRHGLTRLSWPGPCPRFPAHESLHVRMEEGPGPGSPSLDHRFKRKKKRANAPPPGPGSATEWGGFWRTGLGQQTRSSSMRPAIGSTRKPLRVGPEGHRPRW